VNTQHCELIFFSSSTFAVVLLGCCDRKHKNEGFCKHKLSRKMSDIETSRKEMKPPHSLVNCRELMPPTRVGPTGD